ncbi:MAG: GNAT family N-acetyltransferase [Clostridiales bacterium]|nr:GNAT family N-acetyltransferase [Clostridiales bacterium]
MIKYRKADITDVYILSKMRCDFLIECNHLDAKDAEAMEQSCYNYFMETIADGSFVEWLAYDEDVLVATSGICFYKVPPNKNCPNAKTSYIQNMYTVREYRKQGIAKALFIKMIDEAQQHGCTRITLNSTESGKPLYKKFGFKDTEDEMVYYI